MKLTESFLLSRSHGTALALTELSTPKTGTKIEKLNFMVTKYRFSTLSVEGST
jgi:hypothetical protein